jgi:hypothetical protein
MLPMIPWRVEHAAAVCRARDSLRLLLHPGRRARRGRLAVLRLRRRGDLRHHALQQLRERPEDRSRRIGEGRDQLAEVRRSARVDTAAGTTAAARTRGPSGRAAACMGSTRSARGTAGGGSARSLA